MNPQKDQLIQVRFNNGIFFDAIVDEWSDEKSILHLPETNDVVIIQKTLQDVLLVKILMQSKTKKETMTTPINTNEYVEEFNSLKDQPIDDNSLKRMSELKDEMNKIDRMEAFGKMKTFKDNEMKAVQYEFPRSIQVSSSASHTDQKTTSTDITFGPQLQQLFNQKH